MHEQEQAGVGVTLATKTEDELQRSEVVEFRAMRYERFIISLNFSK